MAAANQCRAQPAVPPAKPAGGETDGDDHGREAPTHGAIVSSARREVAAPLPQFDAPIPGVESEARRFDMARLQDLLADLIACRQLIDSALKEG